MEPGYCHCCGNHNPPEEKKCKKCGAEIINLDRSSTIVHGLRSGVIAGAIIALVAGILSAAVGSLFSGSAVVGIGLFIIVFIYWLIAGIIIGAIAGATSSLCFYRNAAGIGAIVGFIMLFLVGGSWYINIGLGSGAGYLASYIERKYFRKMTWL
ncbi:MAG: zinc ribbon domain-containing protein [Candidatus Eremiobacterota bacterium]